MGIGVIERKIETLKREGGNGMEWIVFGVNLVKGSLFLCFLSLQRQLVVKQLRKKECRHFSGGIQFIQLVSLSTIFFFNYLFIGFTFFFLLFIHRVVL